MSGSDSLGHEVEQPMTNTPSREDYYETVKEYAQTAANRYGSTDESREQLQTSKELGEILRGVIDASIWLQGDRCELTIYHSDQSPSDPTHGPIFENAVDLQSEPDWAELSSEAAYLCLMSDVTKETINILVA